MALILGVAVWALLPPAVDDSAPAPSASAEKGKVKYVIKISPGPQYMPDSVPYGIGAPLKGLSNVIRDFEARFPDTRIEVLTVPGVREYLVTQLSSGQAPDIINVNVEDVWVDVQKGWYVPLDPFLDGPNEFIREKGDPATPGYDHWWDMFKYQAISRGKAAPDGLNYCLSYDMVETGIFYNKKIFREVGVDVPKNWDEFIDVMKKIKAAGHTPMLMFTDAFSDWCTDLFFDQMYDCLLPGIDLFQDPTREPYLQGYLDDNEVYFLYHKGFFTRKDPRFVEIWKLMHEFRQYSNQNLATVDITRDFVMEKEAMVWTGCWLAYRLTADKALGFDWGVFYMPQFTKKTTKYACDTPMCVIGGAAVQFEVTNSAVSDTPADLPIAERARKSERVKRVMQFLEFLCVPENYSRIVNEYECFLPNIKGVPVKPALKPFESILERRYTTTKWVYTFDLRFNEIQRRMLELYLNNGINLDEYMDWWESNLKSATENLVVRKKLDLEPLQQAWDRLAPVRAKMEDLPSAR
jgi:ABC-type glycerol-3-phosphate transport system substrate-binding protein